MIPKSTGESFAAGVLDIHEAAAIFPLAADCLDELVADIKANGQLVPIELYEGMIIDGRRRYAACQRAGVMPTTVNVAPDDPVAYVLSLNLHRRHLTQSQRAIIAARAREMYDAHAKLRQRAGQERGRNVQKGMVITLPPVIALKSREAAGKAVGVSGIYIDRARTVLAHATPEVVTAVEHGRMSITEAATLSTQPSDVQRAEAAKPKRYRACRIAANPLQPDHPAATDRGTSETRGVGIFRANEALNSLVRIPKNDALRQRGFQIVLDWIRRNEVAQ